METVKGIAHIALNPLNMEKSLEFYCGVLGMEKAFELRDEAGNPWIIYLKICKNHFLELFYGGENDREYAYDFKKTGYNHLCISVGDIRSLAGTLYEKKIIDSKEPGVEKDLNENLWIHDPDGNAVEFVQYNPDSPQMKSNKGEYPYGGDGYTGFGHAAFVVKDMEKSLEFYCGKLGLQLIYTLNDEEGKPWLNYLRICDGTYLELFFDGQGENPATWKSRGFQHLCLETEDLFRSVDFLRNKGIVLDDEPKQSADLNWQAWIHDPDGNKIELMQIDPESPQAKA